MITETTVELGPCQSFTMNLEKVWVERGWIPFSERIPTAEDGMVRCCFLSKYDYIKSGMRVFEYEDTIPWDGWTDPKKAADSGLRREDRGPFWGYTHWRKV